jgi:WhiB family redox-sensing transcriptional regulator
MSTARTHSLGATKSSVPLIASPAPSKVSVPAVPAARRTGASEGPSPDWRALAACVEQDLNLFFPVSTVGAAAARQVEAAKEVCRNCPVQQSCLEWALDVGPEFGIFGGRTEVERRRLRSRRGTGQRWVRPAVPLRQRGEEAVVDSLEPR